MTPTDKFNRPLHDLRISVTDRCNMRCPHCMPKDVFGPNHEFLPRAQILTFEEIERLVRVFVGLGVVKVRLTGGEPLLRREIVSLVKQLGAIQELRELCLTTNGVLAATKNGAGATLAEELKRAGLSRVTVSLDSLDPGRFAAMTDSKYQVEQVLAGVEALNSAGLSPVKINMVVRAGVNQDDVIPMAEWARSRGHTLRFIEYMDVGASNGWHLEEVVPARDVLAAVAGVWDVEPIGAAYPGEVARRYRYKDGGGEFGLITSVTQPFCSGCTRARVAADGSLVTCLFGTQGFDLRKLVRGTGDDLVLSDAIRRLWEERADRYSELRSSQTVDLPKKEMSFLGG